METNPLCGGYGFYEEKHVSSSEECIAMCQKNKDCFSVSYSFISDDVGWYCYPYTKEGFDALRTDESIVYTKICQPGLFVLSDQLISYLSVQC